LVKTWRLVREDAAARNELSDESLISFAGLIVWAEYCAPRRLPLLKSWTVGTPIAFKAGCTHLLKL
jgi:hypothetical protein